MIECEVCKELISISRYQIHIDTHNSPPPEELPSGEDQLPRAPYKGGGLESNCKICLMDYEMEQPITYLPCIHSFHEICIKTWIKANPNCPVCRKKIFK